MRDRIRDLIPPGGVTKKSRLVLANAIYLKAPWQSEFFKEATKPEPIMSHGFTRVVNSADRILQ
jgi:serine protease inhibitor